MKFLNIYTTSIFSVLVFFYNDAQAQVTNSDDLDLGEVNIIQNYEPILINSDKIPLSPEIPKINKNKADEQTYQFSDVKAKIKYTAEDIKPIKVVTKPDEKQRLFYAKIGFGNYLTPLLNLSITNPNQAKYRAGLNADFIFSKAKKPRFQEYYDFKAKAFGEYFIKKQALIGASFVAQFDKYHFYGNTDSLINKNDIKNRYNRLGADVYLKNIAEKDYNYAATISFQNTTNTLKQKETTLDFEARGSYQFMRNIGAGATIWANNISYKDDTLKYNRFSIAVNPYAVVQYKIWKLQAGANIMITNNKFYILPSINNTLTIYKNYLVMYNEWNSNIKINSLHQTSLENAFTYENNFKNQVNEKRTFVGLRGAFSGFHYNISFAQLVNRNHLQFIDNLYDTIATSFPPKATFQADYVSKMKAWNPSISIGYQKSNQFGSQLTFDYFIYQNNVLELSYQPQFKLDFTAFYNWKNKLYINLNLVAWGSKNAIRQEIENQLIVNRTLQKINTVFDLNISASYFITKNIGVFVDLNNLAFQRYQHFINYPTYSFQAIAGLKISY